MKDLLERTIEANPDWAKRPIMVGLRGSDAHGTKLKEDNPNSVDDTDVFSLVIHPPQYYFGLGGYRKRWDHYDKSGNELDVLVYDIRKWAHLAQKCNPNVLSWLWNEPEDYFLLTQEGRRLVRNRKLFLSKNIFPRLESYAYGQIKKAKASMTGDRQYQGYMGKKRKELVDKHGYDSKNMNHCIRLLFSGIELAKEGTLTTKRPEEEVNYLKRVKRGEFSFEEIEQKADELFEEMKSLRDASDLPEEVDKDKVDELMLDIVTSYYDRIVFS